MVKRGSLTLAQAQWITNQPMPQPVTLSDALYKLIRIAKHLVKKPFTDYK